MKIELEVPDELVGENKPLFLFAGNHHIAFKRPEKGWVIKGELCSSCGECCSESHLEGLPIENGKCKYLTNHPKLEGKFWCGLGKNRPFSCAIGFGRYEPDCTVTWKYPGNKE